MDFQVAASCATLATMVGGWLELRHMWQRHSPLHHPLHRCRDLPQNQGVLVSTILLY